MLVELEKGVNPVFREDFKESDFFNYVHYFRFKTVKEKVLETETKKLYYVIVKDNYNTYYLQEIKDDYLAYTAIMFKEAGYWFVNFATYDLPNLDLIIFKGGAQDFSYYWFETDKIYEHIEEFNRTQVKFIGDLILNVWNYSPHGVLSQRFFDFVIKEARRKKDKYSYLMAIDLLPPDVAEAYAKLHGLPVTFSRSDKTLLEWVDKWLKASKKRKVKVDEYELKFKGHIIDRGIILVAEGNLIGYHPKLGVYTMQIPKPVIVSWG